MTCKTIHIGELKHKIVIQRVTQVADGYGGFTESWAADPAGGVWARLQTLTGTESWKADRLMPGNLIRVHIRWRDDGSGNPYYTSKDRVVYQGRTYSITTVTPWQWERKFIQMDMMESRP